ncbi:MAG: helix-turn-helix domain-containing protein [Nitrospirae bacterium]|nr:helix-turn-helix domain-containing protein [Nitrospirota bacterium]MCL5238274.1 helix-turn-helix domain-containing protein [Nitrospirota bacterium]
MKKDNKKATGELIRELRRAKGISQMKLAEMLDVSYQQIQKYEKGVSSISVERLKQVAHALGVSAGLFFPPEKGMVSEPPATYGKMTDEEQLLLQLFRRIKDKKLKMAVLNLLKSLVK